MNYNNDDNPSLIHSSLAHDTLNLISTVNVYLELLESEVDKSSKAYEYLECVQQEMQHINILLKDMQDLSKNEIILNKSAFKVSELIKELEIYSNPLKKDYNADIKFVIKDDIEIIADKSRLFRVFFNILHNSLKAIKDDNGLIGFYTKKVGSDISFLVLDNGKGIDKKDIAEIFKPFYTKNSEGGKGLGLYIASNIIKAHGGRISLRSKLGEYTCFLIRIPIS